MKSLARPLRRTARLACASRRAPTETRALLAQSNVQYSTRGSRSLLTSTAFVPAPLLLPAPVDDSERFAVKQNLSPFRHSTFVIFRCVCEKCMCAARPNLCFGVVKKRIQDGCHHKAACEHSKYRGGRMTQCKMGRFLSTALVCVGVSTLSLSVFA